MTSGRFTSVSSRARPAAASAPSAVRVAAGPPAVSSAAASGRRDARSTCSPPPARDDVGAGTHSAAAPAPWLAVARRAPPRRRRPGRRRRASAARGGSTRLGQQRAGQAARPPLARRSPQVRERQDHGEIRQRRALGGGDRRREGREQRVLVLLDGVGRAPTRRRLVGSERRVCSQWPPDVAAGGRRAPSAPSPRRRPPIVASVAPM